MIIAGEMSGDLHGSYLVREIQALSPGIKFWGMGGSCLRTQGVEVLCDAAKLAVVGVFEVFSHIKDIREARARLLHEMFKRKPDLLILIDFPDFNLSLAKKAKAFGVPVLYYISPQVWAWRSGRVKKISQLVDKMAVILPFEKDFFAKMGMAVSFVGHPLMDQVKTELTPSEFREKYHISPEKKIIGIIPGSRKKEIEAMLPTFIQAAKQLLKEKPDTILLLPLAPSLSLEDLQLPGIAINELPLQIIHEDRYDLMANCDLAIATSGTVTLELAILKTPMVVAYRTSPITYFLGRRLIKVKYASLVNLIGEEEIVQELIQDSFTSENVKHALLAIWPGTENYNRIQGKLHGVCQQLGGKGASRRTAQLALETISC